MGPRVVCVKLQWIADGRNPTFSAAIWDSEVRYFWWPSPQQYQRALSSSIGPHRGNIAGMGIVMSGPPHTQLEEMLRGVKHPGRPIAFAVVQEHKSEMTYANKT